MTPVKFPPLQLWNSFTTLPRCAVVPTYAAGIPHSIKRLFENRVTV
jgi:hypothetical protein